jgi:trimethylamine-N-oxide reductase cytochrome c-type subunit TorC
MDEGATHAPEAPRVRRPLFARVWRWCRTPSTGISAGLLLLIGTASGIVLWGGFNTVMEATNSLTFCTACHVMRDTVYPEYQRSVHYSNASGVRAICSDCHVPHAWIPKLIRKVQATGELYHFIVGTISTPEKFEAHRLELARSVWATMAATNSRECRNCHSFEAMDFHKQRPAAQEQMPKAWAAGQTCIDCHKGIAHTLPDMSQGYKAMFNDLVSSAAKLNAKPGDTLYPLSTRPLFLDRADAKADANGDGRLLIGSEVHVLARDGDWLQVQIEGWQQQNAERAIYAMQGKRIMTAAITSAASEQFQRQSTMTDQETDLVWYHGRLTAWVTRDKMVADRSKLWDYGSEMYSDTCGSCHALQPPSHYLANQWIGNLGAMQRFISLDDDQFRFLQKYLQFHAQDTGAEHG